MKTDEQQNEEGELAVDKKTQPKREKDAHSGGSLAGPSEEAALLHGAEAVRGGEVRLVGPRAAHGRGAHLDPFFGARADSTARCFQFQRRRTTRPPLFLPFLSFDLSINQPSFAKRYEKIQIGAMRKRINLTILEHAAK